MERHRKRQRVSGGSISSDGSNCDYFVTTPLGQRIHICLYRLRLSLHGAVNLRCEFPTSARYILTVRGYLRKRIL
jgi:hypothetical protein